MTHQLDSLLQALDQYQGPIQDQDIEILLKTHEVTPNGLGEWIQFDHDRYTRNTIKKTEHYELLCLCWLPGQFSPAHDHGTSSGGMKIITGTARETSFSKKTETSVTPESSSLVFEKTVSACDDREIHQVENPKAFNQPMISLHIYSPPLSQYGVYSIEPVVNEPRNEVNELAR